MSACNVEDLSSISGSGRSPREGNGNPLQCSCLENPMDEGAWWATVHGVEELGTTEQLHFTGIFVTKNEPTPYTVIHPKFIHSFPLDLLFVLFIACFDKLIIITWGLPGGATGKELACQCRRCKR